MAEIIDDCNLTTKSFSTQASYIKEEYEDDDYLDNKVSVWETVISTNDTNSEDVFSKDNIKIKPPEMSNTMIYDNVKIEHEADTAEVIKIDKLLFCDICHTYYQDYCTKCEMLKHVLNGNTLHSADDNADEDIPGDILEIRLSSAQCGVFALKIIPKGVSFGPFTGLSASECSRKIKGGRFIVAEDKSNILNWMRHVNSTRNTFEQNLLVFQCKNNLYYRSIREIQVGEELLVYFGEEYADNWNTDVEVDFIADIENDTKDVFACIHCCLGFSSKEYLAKHKTICRNETTDRFSIEELTQCPLCHIYLGEKEYSEYHMTYCSKRNDRKCFLLAPNNETNEVSRHCEYKTTHKDDLKKHANNQHYELKMYKCGMCDKRFKIENSLKVHMEKMHVDVGCDQAERCSTNNCVKAHIKARCSKVHCGAQDEAKQFKCLECEFRTKYKHRLRSHTKSQHLKEFNRKCEMCQFKTNQKSHLDYHIKTKHLKEFRYKCESCGYETNTKSNLELHIKRKHLEEFKYKCELCEFRTILESNLEYHIKTVHLKECNYKCEICDYKTNCKQSIQDHMKTIHLKEFGYKCEICQFKTSWKANLERHVKTKHLEEFDYNCESCIFKTNRKEHLEMHIKTEHLKEFDYSCEICDYKSNKKWHLDRHIKTKHLKEFSYNCDICEYKTNEKRNLERHEKTKHLKEFSYKCESCEYKTNHKMDFEGHVKSKHLKEFNFECEICGYKTNRKWHLKTHLKAKHLVSDLTSMSVDL